MIHRVVVFGDSIVLAPRCHRGWADLLWTPGSAVSVISVHNGRLVDAARRSADVLRVHDRWDLAVFAFGLYDAKGATTPPREAMASLRRAVTTLANGGPVVIVPPHSPTPGCLVPGFNRECRRWIEKTRAGWVDLARDLREAGARVHVAIADLPDVEMSDGIWPKPAGHARIAAAVMAADLPF